MKILNAVPEEGEVLDMDYRRLQFDAVEGLIMHIGICVQRPDDGGVSENGK